MNIKKAFLILLACLLIGGIAILYLVTISLYFPSVGVSFSLLEVAVFLIVTVLLLLIMGKTVGD